ncbi:uncharacterized protein LOC120010231 [Tripterygium wilfordii]|uniref:uncharacterized protein LOC120010231 n=1 Tax=Tripterygium wilfordii TaxID=458696 RepID=UPI0018F8285B|nr:uncharacterized protein LOC120010231 [Tripterygium wilfordii]
MVDMALELERGERNSRQYWDVPKGRKASIASGSGGGSQKKLRTEFQVLRGQKVDQGKGSRPWDGKIVCFKCGWEGHKNQCTTRGVTCYRYGMIDHRKHDCPQGGRASEQSRAPGLPPPTLTLALPSTIPSGGRGRGHQEADEHPNFIGGTFLISNCWAKVLFDSGTTTLFISVSLASLKDNLNVLDFKDFDVILGVDWLTKHHALLDFWERKVTLNVPEGGEIRLHGLKGVPCPHFMDNPSYQNCRVTSLITLAPRGDVATLTHVVEEYMDVFLDKLPGLPPKREIDFTIELHPNVKPILIPPYRMAPVELKELMTQLEEL